jgi:hypothetical protein
MKTRLAPNGANRRRIRGNFAEVANDDLCGADVLESGSGILHRADFYCVRFGLAGVAAVPHGWITNWRTGVAVAPVSVF